MGVSGSREIGGRLVQALGGWGSGRRVSRGRVYGGWVKGAEAGQASARRVVQ